MAGKCGLCKKPTTTEVVITVAADVLGRVKKLIINPDGTVRKMYYEKVENKQVSK